jgi:hypothetical protein
MGIDGLRKLKILPLHLTETSPGQFKFNSLKPKKREPEEKVGWGGGSERHYI